jgi:hypothetical protein
MKNNRSTYSLLLNADAEEKGRSIFESAIYGLVILCTAVSVFQFATSDVVLPTGGQTASSKAAFAATSTQQAQPVRG